MDTKGILGVSPAHAFTKMGRHNLYTIGCAGWTLPLIAGLVLAGVHLSTITLQVPAHGRLEHGWDPIVADRLVRTNWIRTIGWTIRGVLALFMVEAVA